MGCLLTTQGFRSQELGFEAVLALNKTRMVYVFDDGVFCHFDDFDETIRKVGLCLYTHQSIAG